MKRLLASLLLCLGLLIGAAAPAQAQRGHYRAYRPRYYHAPPYRAYGGRQYYRPRPGYYRPRYYRPRPYYRRPAVIIRP